MSSHPKAQIILSHTRHAQILQSKPFFSLFPLLFFLFFPSLFILPLFSPLSFSLHPPLPPPPLKLLPRPRKPPRIKLLRIRKHLGIMMSIPRTNSYRRSIGYREIFYGIVEPRGGNYLACCEGGEISFSHAFSQDRVGEEEGV